MHISSLQICQQALVLIGAQPLTSFDDGTTESIACSNLYENTARDELGQYRWRFASNQVQLSRLVDVPSAKWEAAYQLPPECLSISTVYVNDIPIDFDRYEDNVFCNAEVEDVVILEGTFRVDEQFWPPYFVQMMVYRIASQLAHSIAAQVDTSDLLDQRAMRHARMARNRDAQGRTAPKIDTSRLINTRFRNSSVR